MALSKKLNTLIKELNRQTLIAEAAEEKARELKAQVLALLNEEGATKVETAYGKANVIEMRCFDYSGFPQIEEAKSLIKTLKEQAETTAPFTVNRTLRFNPNRGYAVPEPKTTRVWKSQVVIQNDKVEK